MPVRIHNIPIASGATRTSMIYIGPSYKVALVLSSVTAINSAAGNAQFYTYFGLSESDTIAQQVIYPNTVTTETTKGIYALSTVVTPYISIGTGSTVTGGGNSSVINLVVYSYDL